jgi:hypothetical protein
MACDAVAYVDKETGSILLDDPNAGIDEDEKDEIPTDVLSNDRYIEVPHKREFDLGTSLVFDFAADKLPDHYDDIRNIFRKKGAYSRFKELLISLNRIDQWHEYENNTMQAALVEWCEDEGLSVNLK